ncbi:MAG: antibiotic biosynthesis monooxygenase [Nocardioidaceae bacterium]
MTVRWPVGDASATAGRVRRTGSDLRRPCAVFHCHRHGTGGRVSRRWRYPGAAPRERVWAVHARTITIDARPEAVEAGLAYVRDEVLPTVLDMPGCIGMSMVADRVTGRCIATSAWESEEAMHASEGPVAPTRARAAEILGGPPQVEEWEIALMHRDHRSGEGACVRSTWLTGDPANLERNIDVFKLTTLPALEQFDGFCSASLLVNRASGRVLATIAYDSPQAREQARQQADALRSRTASEMAAKVQDVREFDLVHAHLHVPEMA